MVADLFPLREVRFVEFSQHRGCSKTVRALDLDELLVCRLSCFSSAPIVHFQARAIIYTILVVFFTYTITEVRTMPKPADVSGHKSQA